MRTEKRRVWERVRSWGKKRKRSRGEVKGCHSFVSAFLSLQLCCYCLVAPLRPAPAAPPLLSLSSYEALFE